MQDVKISPKNLAQRTPSIKLKENKKNFEKQRTRKLEIVEDEKEAPEVKS